MPASLHGLAKFWFLDETVKGSVEQGGLGALVRTSTKGGLAMKDEWHAIENFRVVEPVIILMRDQHSCKTPSLPEIERQVSILGCLISGQPVNDQTVKQIQFQNEVDLHLAAASIKKIMSYLRGRFLCKSVPRDMGSKNQVLLAA
eukprot:Skav224019  [mRNA]  locus=scaffold3238:48745:49179:- [translate_table: standard]